MTINAGNVGIGTTSPSELLHVYNTSSSLNANSSIALETAGGGGKAVIGATANSVTGGLRKTSLYFSTYDQVSGDLTKERMRIDNLGNVGIGTTSPGTKLHLYDSTATTDLPSLKLDSTYITGDSTGLPMSSIYFANTGTNVNAIQSAERTVNNYALDFQTYNGSSLGTRMSIIGNGNVGIGTTSPDQKLNIFGTNSLIKLEAGALDTGFLGVEFGDDTTRVKNAIVSNFTTTWGRQDLHFVVDTAADNNGYTLGTDTKMFISGTTGNVGIGTASPGRKLTVTGTQQDALQYLFEVGANNSGAQGKSFFIGVDAGTPEILLTTGELEQTLNYLLARQQQQHK